MEPFTSPELASILVAGLAVFRLAKLLTEDALFKRQREWLVAKLVVSDKKGILESGPRVKLAYLVGCPVCAGVWLSVAVAAILASEWPWNLGVDGWVACAAIAGVQVAIQSLTAPKPNKEVE